MRRNTLNYVVDGATFLSMCSVAVTGVILKWVLPPGTQREGLTLFGWLRHDWGEVHFWTTVSLGALVVLHVILHWQWVCTTTARLIPRVDHRRLSPGRRRALGAIAVVGVAALFGGVVMGGRALVERPEPTEGETRQRRRRGREGG